MNEYNYRLPQGGLFLYLRTHTFLAFLLVTSKVSLWCEGHQPTQSSLEFFIMTQFNSSVITAISDVADNQVTVEFHGRPYTYSVTDVAAWQTELSDVISEGESVGGFVNRAIRSGVLVNITA